MVDVKEALFIYLFIYIIDFRERSIYYFTYTFIGWFLYVPWLGIKPETLAYWGNALPTELSGQGQETVFKKTYLKIISHEKYYLR